MIDSFVYLAIGTWHFKREDEKITSNLTGISFEQHLFDYYNNQFSYADIIKPTLYAPGSKLMIECDDWDVLGKVLGKIV